MLLQTEFLSRALTEYSAKAASEWDYSAIERADGAGEITIGKGAEAAHHWTSSALLITEDRTEIVMIFHDKIRRWLQPGGHIEPFLDQCAEAGARRELLEEVSFTSDEPAIHLLFDTPFDFDIHTVGKGVCQDHYDFRYLYTCAQDRPGNKGAEMVFCRGACKNRGCFHRTLLPENSGVTLNDNFGGRDHGGSACR